MKKSKSLKKEILLLLILICVTVIVITGIFSAFNLYKNKLNSIDHNQEQVLIQVEFEINNFIDKIIKISNLLKSNYDSDNSIIENIVKIDRNVTAILVLDDKGTIVNFSALNNLNIYKGFDYSNKNYFKNLNDEKNSYWSSVFLSSIDDEPSVSYSFKYENKVFVFLINFEDISSFIKRFKNIDKSHMIRVIDKDGTIIINPDNEDMVLQRFNASYSDVYTSLINKVKAYEQKKFKPIKGKKTQYGTYINIDKTNWKVIAREDYTNVISALSNIMYITLFFIIIFILISIYFSLKMSKKIFKVFDQLKNTTTKISNGNYEIKVPKSDYIELNNFINSFNVMQKEIDKREEYLEASLESFKALFNSTLESIILIKNTKIIDVNDITLNLFEAKGKEDFIEKDILDFIDSKYKLLMKENITKNTEPYEIEFIKFNDEKINTIVQSKCLKFLGENIRVTAIIDITEIKQKDRLLFQQSKMASMGEMIGNIAHQWRQPLSVITTCASGIRLEKEMQTLNDENFEKSIEHIVDNCKYLSKTIDDFRNFFKQDRKIEEFCLHTYIQKVLKLVSSSLKNNDIDIELDFEREQIYLKGVPSEFMQVFINLINNSKDAFILNNIKRRKIIIKTKRLEDKVLIEVTDGAGGIKEEIIDKIFEPYFTTKHKSKGTGIGLYMSHQIINEHFKGNIEVKNCSFMIDNKSYKGTSFILDIPLNKNEYILDYII
ncbi:ATP-binding protein [Arcobacter sp. YIC-310]|uniref:ATP-binding protein n=1 Tax=Arcobacter sp. YIC-310 TaxID=3376632 RepID=UPI003C1B3C20